MKMIDEEYKHRILCHVAGLNENYKKKIIMFVNKISHIISIIDLDDISNSVNREPKMESLLEQYNNYKNNLNPKVKDVENEIKQYWYDKMVSYIHKFFENTVHKVVVLGSCIHFKFSTKKIEFGTEHRFFLDVDNDKISKQIIAENLSLYKDEIINGDFPLDYLNISFLNKKRFNIQKIYQKMGYKAIGWKELINFINPCKKDHELWCASFEKNLNSKIKVFPYPWLAIASLIDKDVDINFINGEPHIAEKTDLILQKLRTNGYLFQIKSNNVLVNKSNHYKFKIHKPFEIIKELPLDNIFKKLTSYNVKFTYYGITE
jgi:hypothetical protein